jgi:hypothetical protein
VLHAAELDGAAHDARIAAESAAPRVVADEENGRRLLLLV